MDSVEYAYQWQHIDETTVLMKQLIDETKTLAVYYTPSIEWRHR